jgi:type I restriction enzyme S subunit
MTKLALKQLNHLVDPVKTWSPERSAPGERFVYIDLSAVDQDAKAIAAARELPCTEAPSRAKQIVAAGDVLVSTVRPNLNAVARVPPELDGATASTGFCVLRPRLGKLDGAYLLHWVKSPRFVSEMVRRATGASYPAVSDRIILESSLPLPSLLEQRRIAEILDKADMLGAKRRAALVLLDTLTESIFLDMFGDPRKKGSLGRTPATPKLLGSLTRIRTGKLDANAADDDGAYPFFTCAVDPLRINTPAFDCRAVLVAGNGDLNVKYYDGKFNAYQRTYVIESVDEKVLVPQFLYAFLDLYVSELRKQAIGGVIKYIKLPYLTDAVIPLPSEERQLEFAQRLRAVEALKTTLRASMAELGALFSNFQHLAFHGEL